LRSDAGTLVDQIGVVGDDGVTRVLRDDTDGDDDGKPPAVTLGAEEVHVAAGAVGLLLKTEGFADFAELELDGEVLIVAIGMPLGQSLESFFVAVL
jgi:hypothetical protein